LKTAVQQTPVLDKSAVTNLLALAIMLTGYGMHSDVLFNIGLFAVSGAITNWLAVHMLFEKVPGLYGSGVIPARFEQFKQAISELMMEQFFSEANIDRFLSTRSDKQSLDLSGVIAKVDLAPAFAVKKLSRRSSNLLLKRCSSRWQILPRVMIFTSCSRVSWSSQE